MFTGRGRAMKRIRDQMVPDKLHDMADRHSMIYDLDSLPDFLKQRRPMTPQQIARESYLAGAREALEMNHGEIVEENYELHHTVFQLIARYGVTACEKCNSSGLDDPADLTECSVCGGDGWIEAKKGCSKNCGHQAED